VCSAACCLLRYGIASSEFGNLKHHLGTLRDFCGGALTRWRRLCSQLGGLNPRVIPGGLGLYACVPDEGARVMKRAEKSASIPSISSRPAFGFPGARGAGGPIRLSRLDLSSSSSLLHDDSRPGEPRRRAPRPPAGLRPCNPSTRGVGHAECRPAARRSHPASAARPRCPLHDPATCRICGPGIDLLSEQELSNSGPWSSAKHGSRAVAFSDC